METDSLGGLQSSNVSSPAVSSNFSNILDSFLHNFDFFQQFYALNFFKQRFFSILGYKSRTTKSDFDSLEAFNLFQEGFYNILGSSPNKAL